MDVTEEALLSAGFTRSDLQKIKNNIESYGGTLGEVIQDLANRFRVVLWITSSCLMVFILLMLFAAKETVVGGGISYSSLSSSLYLFSRQSCLTNPGGSGENIKVNTLRPRRLIVSTLFLFYDLFYLLDKFDTRQANIQIKC